MGQSLLHRPHLAGTGPAGRTQGLRDDPGAAARGILLALAASTLFWIALALAVPRLW